MIKNNVFLALAFLATLSQAADIPARNYPCFYNFSTFYVNGHAALPPGPAAYFDTNVTSAFQCSSLVVSFNKYYVYLYSMLGNASSYAGDSTRRDNCLYRFSIFLERYISALQTYFYTDYSPPADVSHIFSGSICSTHCMLIDQARQDNLCAPTRADLFDCYDVGGFYQTGCVAGNAYIPTPVDAPPCQPCPPPHTSAGYLAKSASFLLTFLLPFIGYQMS
jgi:hypothetical protein